MKLNYTTKTNEELAVELQQKLEEAKKNKVLKEIKLRDGEEDIRKVTQADYRQLDFRLKSDFWAYLNNLNSTLVALQIITMEIARKMGIDIEQVLDEITKVDSK